jgi:hypothetical protein
VLNSHFFFLWPIRSINQLPPATGFNPELRPVVEICRLTAPETCGEVVATLTMTSGSPLLNRVFVLRDRKEYAALWVAKNLVTGKSYRIRVVVGGKVLGFADLDVLTTLNAVLAYPNRSTFVPILKTFDGSALPIRFWIGDGAFGATNPADHFEGSVTNAGGTFTTNTGFAGARFPPEWLPLAAAAPPPTGAGITEVVVIIERVPVDNSNATTSCLRSGLLEMEGCYRFRTEPDLTSYGPFNADVTAALCFEIPSVIGTPDAPPFQLHRREDGDGLFGPTFPLEDAPAGFVHCETFTRTPSPSPRLTGSGLGGVRDLARAGWHALAGGIARLLSPRAVYAVDLGAGGLTKRFSHFGWARAATLEAVSPLNQSATPSSMVPLSTRVVISHHAIIPVPAAPVSFTVVRGIGSLSAASVPTAANGVATANLTLSLAAGTNVVEASTPNVNGSPVTFTASSRASFGFETYPDATPTCQVCGVTNEFAATGVDFQWNSPTYPNTTATLADGVGSFYGDNGNKSNHFVTSAVNTQGQGIAGVLSMAFPGLPGAVQFDWSISPNATQFLVTAFDAGGSPIPSAQITRNVLGTYSTVSGATLRRESVRITSASLIQRVVFDMSGFGQVIDNVNINP